MRNNVYALVYPIRTRLNHGVRAFVPLPPFGGQACEERRSVTRWALNAGIPGCPAIRGSLLPHDQRQEQAALATALAKVRLENQQMRDEIRRMHEHPAAAMEEAARRELGLIRPGETLVIIRDAHPATTAQVPR